MTAYWDDQAATFDDEPDHGLVDPVTREAWRRLFARVLPDRPSDVVDLGCGTGTLTALLGGLGHRLRALDSSARMVDAARAKLAEAGHDVPVVVADASLPPYGEGSADVVLCRHVLWALPDPDAVLARWTSLLRPGGRLVLVEGRWQTGGGISAAECETLVRPHCADVTVEVLADPAYWGRPIDDERYLLIAR